MNIIDRFKLTGKKVFVTGGAMGIGKCVAQGLAQAGADIAIVDIEQEKADITAKEIADAYGVKTLSVLADVTRPDDVNSMIKNILDAFGTIDVAFNNAGIATIEKAEELTIEDWKKVIDVNLTGVFLTAQAAAKVMIKNGGGSIINTASMSGHIVNVPQTIAHYNSSKAGVIQLTKSLAVEWAKHKIRVNSISPGYIGTELVASLTEFLPEWTRRTPLGRIGYPEDLQGAVLFLASEASAYATGTDLVIDGGYTCV